MVTYIANSVRVLVYSDDLIFFVLLDELNCILIVISVEYWLLCRVASDAESHRSVKNKQSKQIIFLLVHQFIDLQIKTSGWTHRLAVIHDLLKYSIKKMFGCQNKATKLETLISIKSITFESIYKHFGDPIKSNSSIWKWDVIFAHFFASHHLCFCCWCCFCCCFFVNLIDLRSIDISNRSWSCA